MSNVVPIKPYTCTDCGKACNAAWVDFGIGINEFWGAVSNDINYQWVSDCCEADTVEDADWEAEG